MRINNKPFIKISTPIEGKYILTPGFMNCSKITGFKVTSGKNFKIDIFLENHTVAFTTKSMLMVESIASIIHSHIITNLSMSDRYDGLGFITKPDGVITKQEIKKGSNILKADSKPETIINLDDIIFWDFELNKDYTIFNIFFDLKGGNRITWVFNTQEEQEQVLDLLLPYCRRLTNVNKSNIEKE